jgi:hypothetical protein
MPDIFRSIVGWSVTATCNKENSYKEKNIDISHQNAFVFIGLKKLSVLLNEANYQNNMHKHGSTVKEQITVILILIR